MGSTWADVRHALRGLGRSPVLTGVAVLTLALGIGATTAVFSVVNAVLLRPLAFHEPDRLVQIFTAFPGLNLTRGVLSEPEFVDFADASGAFEEAAAFTER